MLPTLGTWKTSRTSAFPRPCSLNVDDINPTMEQTDLCLVIGANDTVNPDGRCHGRPGRKDPYRFHHQHGR